MKAHFTAYLRLVIFVGGALVGVQLPGFLNHYAALTEGRLQEAERAVGSFQDEADRFFEGDIKALSAHYLSQSDAIVNAGGRSIEALVARRDSLQALHRVFEQGGLAAWKQLLIPLLPDVREQAWGSYGYNVVLDARALVWALGLGLVLSVICESLAAALLSGLARLRRRPDHKASS